MTKTPQIIHYCWFGGKPLPRLAKKCIASWKKFLPDYEIREWNESNFDVNIIAYTKQAYEAKKYAFVSDYARFWILYNYGGLYFDTDVEIIKPLNDIIECGPFMGCEKNFKEDGKPYELGVNPGLGLGVSSGNKIYKELLDLYSSLDFNTSNNKTIVSYTSELLYNKGMINSPEIQIVNDIYIYPKDYFCPINYLTNKLEITQNTRSIHHYSASWHNTYEKFVLKIAHILGPYITKKIVNAKNKLLG